MNNHTSLNEGVEKVVAGFFKVTAISPCLVQKDLDLVCQHFSDTVVYAAVSSVSLKINFKADLKKKFFLA